MPISQRRAKSQRLGAGHRLQRRVARRSAFNTHHTMKDSYPEIQGGGSLILAWQIRNKRVLVVGGGEVRLPPPE